MTKIFLLILATFIWGLGFVGTRWTMQDYSAIWSNSMRFSIAGILSIPFLFKYKNLILNKGVIICSILLGTALQLQTIGIFNTTMAKSGFLTVFYALFTPVLMMFLYKKHFRKTYWLLLLLALIGIALLCELKIESFNRGDFFILISAFVFALHILAIDKYSRNESAIGFNFAQCFYIGIFTLIFALIFEGPVSIEPLLKFESLTYQSSLYGFLILSLFSSIIAFTLQVYTQQAIEAHIVSLIFLMESIFAAIFGYLFFKEVLSVMAIIGCILVLVSVILIPRFTYFEKSEQYN